MGLSDKAGNNDADYPSAAAIAQRRGTLARADVLRIRSRDVRQRCLEQRVRSRLLRDRSGSAINAP
jgi:hypothetical protein